MNKKIIISVLLIGVLAFSLGLGSYAWFTSQATSSDNTFTTGTLRLDQGGLEAFNLNDEVNKLKPSDITRLITIDIINDGSLDLAWFGKFIVSDDTFVLNDETRSLTEAIYIEEMQMEFLKPDEHSQWEPTDKFIVNGRGSGTYGGHYDGLVDSTLGVITLKNFLNDNAMGVGAGVQMGALKEDYSYRLSFKLGFAPLANNDYQGRTMKIEYQVNATQLNANALNALFDQVNYISGTAANHTNWLNAQIAKQN